MIQQLSVQGGARLVQNTVPCRKSLLPSLTGQLQVLRRVRGSLFNELVPMVIPP